MPQLNLLDGPEAFQFYFGNHPDGIWLTDADGRIRNVNASALAMFGYTRDEMLQLSLSQLLPGDCSRRSEQAVTHKGGGVLTVKVTCVPLENDGQDKGKLLILEPIGIRKNLTDIQEMFSFISEKSQNVITSFSADGIFTYVSPSVKDLLGYAPEEVIGQPAVLFNHPDDNPRLKAFREAVTIDQDTERFTGRIRHRNGEYRWYETTVEYIRDKSGNIIQAIGVGRDITDRKAAEETIRHLAYHDSLTSLPNRRMFQQEVASRLSDPEHGPIALMLLDLDGFKLINDNHGHEVGDRLLVEVAGRLEKVVGEQGLVARWGGDEFTVLLSERAGPTDAVNLADRIKLAVAEPILLSDKELNVKASIGIAASSGQGDSVDTLIRSADKAMYGMKNRAKPSHIPGLPD